MSAPEPLPLGPARTPSVLARMVPSARASRPELTWIQIIHMEITAVTTAMRKNARWSLSSYDSFAIPKLHSDYDYCADSAVHGVDGLESVLEFTSAVRNDHVELDSRLSTLADNPTLNLLHGFAKLKARLTLIHDLRDLDPSDLLAPFLDIIRSGNTTGPITGTALNSIEAFIKYRVLDPHHPSLPAAMALLTHSVTQCKFQATDAVSDEVVLSRILRLLRVIVGSDAGQKSLSDKGICEMVEISFGMCFQVRSSELLRRAADKTLSKLVQALFERLTTIMKAKDHDKRMRDLSLGKYKKEKPEGLSISAPLTPLPSNRAPALPLIASPTVSFPSDYHVLNSAGVEEPSSDLERQKSIRSTLSDGGATSAGDYGGYEKEFQPFGLPSILELVRVLVTLIDPRNRNHTDSMHRMVALNLLATAVEVGGQSLGKWIGQGTQYTKERKLREASQAAAGHHSHHHHGHHGHHHRTPSSSGGLPLLGDIKITTQEPVSSVVSVGVSEEQPGTTKATIILNSEEDTTQVVDVASPPAQGLQEPVAPLSAIESENPEPNLLPPIDTTADEDASDEDKMALAVKDLVLNDLCKHLFQLLQNPNVTVQSPPSATTLSILNVTLRVIVALFQTEREHFKVQQEWLLQWLMSKVDNGLVGWMNIDDLKDDASQVATGSRSSVADRSPSVLGLQKTGILVGEVRELVLDTILQLSYYPHFMTELYINYDADLLSARHLFEELMWFLARNSFPDMTPNGPITAVTHQIICFDTLLMFIKHLVDRRNVIDVSSHPEGLSPEHIAHNKTRKRVLKEGADRFNIKPKDGIAFWQENHYLPADLTPQSVAALLKTTPGIDKRLLGDYISRPDNLGVLKSFIEMFDFNGKRLDEALRLLLESFRLPGESQQIARIMETFAEIYFQTIQGNPERDIETQDATYILSYSVIMLNTDQHNPQVRRRMTYDDFCKNLRGVNNGKDFSKEYLLDIYQTIRDYEIVMPEEHEGDLGFNYAWQGLLKSSETTTPFIFNRSTAYDKDLFLLSWRAILEAISYVFENAEDDLTIQKGIVGFYNCALLATHFNQSDVFDTIVDTLARVSGLLESNGKFSGTDLAWGDDRGSSGKKVDPWAIEFGRNTKGQIATVLLFSLVSEHGDVVVTGWKNIMACLKSLFVHNLIPANLVEVDDFLRGRVKIPLLQPPPVERPVVEARRDTAGIFSTLQQLLLLAGPTIDERVDESPQESDLNAERRATECIAASNIERLFSESRFLETQTLQLMMRAIIESSFVEESGSASRSNLSEQAAITHDPSGNSSAPEPHELNPSAIFLFELLVQVTIFNRDRLQVVWPLAFEHIKTLLGYKAGFRTDALQCHSASALLRLIMRLAHHQDTMPQVLQSLDFLLELSPDTLATIGEPLMAGLVQLVQTHSSLLVSCAKSDTILALLSKSSMNPAAAGYGFQVTTFLISEGSSSIVSSDNFSDCVDLLIGYSVASGALLLAGSGSGSGKLSESDRKSPRPTVPAHERGKSPHVHAAIERSLKSLERLYMLHTRIPELITQTSMRPERAWFEYWLPILSGLEQQCYHPSREVRQAALTYLQRALLSRELLLEGSRLECWISCLENVLFPLLEELLKPAVFKLDEASMDETRMRAVGLLCKFFLNFLPRLVSSRELVGLWGRILEYMKSYLDVASMPDNVGRTGILYEGVLESLKNMLLVMSMQGVFQFTETGSPTSNLWSCTWEHLDPFLPGLRDELFPPGGEPPALNPLHPVLPHSPTDEHPHDLLAPEAPLSVEVQVDAGSHDNQVLV
ncbi:uncharacterized protein BJ171DRAFT_489303 [Polychytrium aggregatum]|uniref:uncharacterized protein n=1 Tax=Polychytrium aggregatum TaxID=110093 RepID=UPI0022FE6FF4|nr:uncharacterized protein BJ171DRAFT_489303 [Polychytrium aggregatum]KAI9208547.1 hypothetical protein BJ171DRAFT_489303 [Polychytrium aggregatum]